MNNGIVNERRIKQPKAEDVLALESLIRNTAEAIKKEELELKQNREMYFDSFNSNPTYREHDSRVKEVSKARNSVKAEILKQPAVAKLNQKVKDLSFDINEKKKAMSELLLSYKEKTKATQLELFDGVTCEIVQSAKLVRTK